MTFDGDQGCNGTHFSMPAEHVSILQVIDVLVYTPCYYRSVFAPWIDDYTPMFFLHGARLCQLYGLFYVDLVLLLHNVSSILEGIKVAEVYVYTFS